MLKNTEKCFETLEKAEARKESEEIEEVVAVAEVGVNEEEIEWRTEEVARCEEDGTAGDPEHAKKGREEEADYMVKTLEMFVLGSDGRRNVESGQGPDNDEMGRSREEG